MASPSVVQTGTSAQSSNNTSQVVAYPIATEMVVGNLLICVMGIDATAATTVTWPSTGDDIWVRFFEVKTNNLAILSIAYHVVTGSEGGNFTVTTSNIQKSGHCIYEITDAAPPGDDPPEVSSGATGDSTSVDPVSITASISGQDNLFIGCCGIDNRLLNGYPANCPDENISIVAGGGGRACAGMASDELTQDTFNPDAFSLGTAEAWAAATVLVLPPQGAAPVLMSSSITEDDSISAAKLDALALITASLTEDDSISAADLTLTAALAASLTDTDAITGANLVIAVGIVLMSASLTEGDTLTGVDLTRFMKMAASLVEDDSITQATLDSLAKLTASLADDDSVTGAALRLFMKISASLAEDDTISAAKLDALALISASLADDDSLTQTALTLTAALTASLTDTDTISGADLVIVVAVLLMTASLTDDDSVSGADLTRYMRMTASLTDDDSLSAAALDALVKISASLADDDAISGADLIRYMKLAASLTEEDLITAADLLSRTKMSASIVEWDAALAGGGPYATGIIMG